ncbi:MAG: hypothetical protein ACYCYP_01395 [Leptospirales bacterium]
MKPDRIQGQIPSWVFPQQGELNQQARRCPPGTWKRGMGGARNRQTRKRVRKKCARNIHLRRSGKNGSSGDLAGGSVRDQIEEPGDP